MGQGVALMARHGQKEPAGQSEQLDAPAAEKEPLGQSVALMEERGQEEPAGHKMHAGIVMLLK